MNHTFECMSSTSAERSMGHFRTQMAYKIKSSQKWSEDLTQAQDMTVHIENGGFNYLALETRVFRKPYEVELLIVRDVLFQ